MSRLAAFAAAAVLLASACTSGPGPEPAPSGSPQSTGRPLVLTFVGTFPEGQPYLDGAELARLDLGAGVAGRSLELRVEPAGDDPATVVADAAGRSAAVLYQGPGSVLTEARPALEEADAPVVLLQGDLYSDRALFPQAFQAGPPLLWQARELARYLAVRGEREAILALPPRQSGVARRAWRSAAAEEGLTWRQLAPPTGGSGPPGSGTGTPVVTFGDAAAARFLAADFPSSQILATFDVLASRAGGELPPGTVAVGTYAWSGWAEPIPRVSAFRASFREAFGGLPLGPQQEGYDALRVLARGLTRTGGEGGAALSGTLEGIGGATFSTLPVALGPDDHTFVDELQLGAFAVPGRDEVSEPWLVPDAPWRPVMRTFTSDGERTIVLERDRGPFWPAWHPPAPSPKYRSSRLGITTGPDDPLH